MIRCHLARLMGEHKMRIADVIRETGLRRNTITLLYKETAQKVDLDALDKLCVLFDCELSELLERVPAQEDAASKLKEARHGH
ncbi:helix-turn-helix domain-containing protein [Methylobacter sp. sgz302048]|uniref:helix-turn-helix domain-containing protein n=1 Tax=Methylobacter sp. sgz302048 TaxID=3455945 RepID=UPI003FA1700A